MEAGSFPDFSDISLRKIAYCASAVVASFIAFSFFYEIELKKDVPAEIVSQGEIKVRGLSGLVTKVYATRGMEVKAGEHLFQLDRDFSLASNGMTRQDFTERYRDNRVRMIGEQSSQKEVELKTRINGLRSILQNRQEELNLLAQEIDESRRQIDEAEKTRQRLQLVSEYVVADRIEQAKSEVAQRKINLSQRLGRQREIASDMSSTRSSLKEAETALASQDIQARRDVQDAQLDYERNRSSAIISAPASGLVSFSQTLQGHTLREDDVAMVIATGLDQGLQAALHIPSRQRGFIREGQLVRLKFDSFPYAKFGTYEVRITSISRDAVASSAASAVTPGAPSVPVIQGDSDYVAYARLPGADFIAKEMHYQILPGMRATAGVVVERRTIAEWVLAPLFEAVRG
ncbi:hypothetical protein PMI16_02698 [Herbaspirillum sp. CF444]|uniref:HlyD family efflux transporter periplasmic adaptor subunit n=1 Tax=Herbaspirillum sp. CF444 TaxID=1144319 RepID=UPI00027268E0|nr:HlyD family efflux transporter periplasmic adaptor subunit [Herbaspirillum sp. CF444]EJL87812.1 hypothetical protein PMI16_02698 [Herbaspirillum sp. CF444]